MFKVQIIRSGSAPFHFKVSAEDLNLNDESSENNFSDIIIDGEIVDDGKLFNVKGTIKCRKSFICDRCLEPSIEEQLHEFNEELTFSEVEDNIADLTELLRDTVIASQPIQNLCKSNCKGLCPICGANLNKGDCKCDQLIVDPRLEVLKNFLNK